MKKAKKIEVGTLVKVPIYEFAPFRTGWNGWIFRVGVVEKLYISKLLLKILVLDILSQ